VVPRDGFVDRMHLKIEFLVDWLLIGIRGCIQLVSHASSVAVDAKVTDGLVGEASLDLSTVG
jgi:hypothetical protein